MEVGGVAGALGRMEEVEIMHQSSKKARSEFH